MVVVDLSTYFYECIIAPYILIPNGLKRDPVKCSREVTALFNKVDPREEVDGTGLEFDVWAAVLIGAMLEAGTCAVPPLQT